MRIHLLHRARCGALFALLLLPLGLAAQGSAPSPALGADAPRVVTHTYLQALPGQRAALAAFLRRNWLVMDSIATAQGLLRGYRLLENTRTDADWDLLVEVTYGAGGYEAVAAQFERIRAAHPPVLVSGKGLPQLGRIVRSETLTVLHQP